MSFAIGDKVRFLNPPHWEGREGIIIRCLTKEDPLSIYHWDIETTMHGICPVYESEIEKI